MIERNEDRDVLRGLTNAIISWRHHHAHDVPHFRDVDKWLRRADDVLRRHGYFGDAAQRALDDPATGIDI
jgi:hypothetical protein